ncbi:MAG TPA: acyl carrier protein [Chloroflexota bacterium]
MTDTSLDSARAVVLRALRQIAPEADLAALDANQDLREQLDIDSVDFLNFVVALHRELGVDIPEADYAKVRTLDGCIRYLSAARVA